MTCRSVLLQVTGQFADMPTRGLDTTRGLDKSWTRQLADATGDFVCLSFILLAIYWDRELVVREFSSSYRSTLLHTARASVWHVTDMSGEVAHTDAQVHRRRRSKCLQASSCKALSYIVCYQSISFACLHVICRPHEGPRQPPPSFTHSLPHLLLLSFTFHFFHFLTRFTHFLTFPSLPFLSE